MSKIPYEAAEVLLEAGNDVLWASNDNAFIDPWGMIPDYGA